METSVSRTHIHIRSVALPSEHGGWGFLIEPILLGLLVAPTWGGFLLALAAVGVFLLHQPLKIAVKDRIKGHRPPRARWAERFVILYGLLALAPMSLLLLMTTGDFWAPILLATPFAIVQLAYDARNQSRQLAAEVCGAWALAMIAPSIVMVAGWSLGQGLALWLILALRGGTSILYVRARLQLEHGKPASRQVVWLAHGLAMVALIALYGWQRIPWLTLAAFGMLCGRAVVGLSRYRKPRAAKIIGFQELGYGLATVFSVALGYALSG